MVKLVARRNTQKPEKSAHKETPLPFTTNEAVNVQYKLTVEVMSAVKTYHSKIIEHPRIAWARRCLGREGSIAGFIGENIHILSIESRPSNNHLKNNKQQNVESAI